MARQKEHLATQQRKFARQVRIGVIPPNRLQHQASAHSLQSQPSYGSNSDHDNTLGELPVAT
jgi:PERQ amino acid-rich with GYF domain-containing protein